MNKRKDGMENVKNAMRNRKTITIEKSRDQIFREALCREESVRLHRINEARIVEPYEEPPPPLPRWLPETKRVSVWKVILSEAVNLAKI